MTVGWHDGIRTRLAVATATANAILRLFASPAYCDRLNATILRGQRARLEDANPPFTEPTDIGPECGCPCDPARA